MRAFCALESPSQEAVLPGENPVGGMTHGRQGGRGGVCPLASDQIHLVTVFGLCVSERVDRGVGRHPEPRRLKISNYFCLGTYQAGTAFHRYAWDQPGQFLDLTRVRLPVCPTVP